MKITIYGAGAIGGYTGAMLAHAGLDVSLVARGEHLKAIRTDGLKVLSADGEFVVRPRATDDPTELGEQDYVFVTLKSHQARHAVQTMQPLLGPDTTVVSAMNGVPWWYFYKVPGEWENRRVKSVDPDGAQWEGIGPERALGCITLVAAEVTAPGVIQHGNGKGYPIGEPSGEESERVSRLVEAMRGAGLDAKQRPQIRDDIWVKLMGNASGNPIAALTCATLGDMVDEPGVRQLMRTIMLETQSVARALGAQPQMDVDRRLAGMSGGTRSHKSSMLQDLERGRTLEIDPIVGAVAELGDLAGVETPFLDAVLGLIRLRGRVGGMYD